MKGLSQRANWDHNSLLSEQRSKAHVRADARILMFPAHTRCAAAAWTNECPVAVLDARQGLSIMTQNNAVSAYLSSSSGLCRTGAAADQLAFTHAGLQTPLAQLDSSSAKAQQSMAHSLADMRPAEDIPVYVMLPLDTVSEAAPAEQQHDRLWWAAFLHQRAHLRPKKVHVQPSVCFVTA